jgi:hypothetical protein
MFRRILTKGSVATAAVLAWLATVATGMAMLSAYASTPGAPANPPPAWPAASTIDRRAGTPTLLVFAHPNCPCTRATLAELDRLLAHADGATDVHVVLWQPDPTDAAPVETSLADLAAAVPRVQVQWDAGGEEAARFGVATSGEVLLYDGTDRLRFAGGITGARGHEGDNAGSDALLGQLTTDAQDSASAPVFGCELGSRPSNERDTTS